MVKKNIRNILTLPLFMIFLGLCNCTKAPMNGHLDGRWQILEIEENGQVRNVKDDQLYYNFYMHVCALSYYGNYLTEANMRYENDEIWLQFPYVQTPEGYERLKSYGIYSNPVTFNVEYLSRSKLIMKEGDVIITLRKF